VSSTLYFIENVTSDSGKYGIVDLTKTRSYVTCKSKIWLGFVRVELMTWLKYQRVIFWNLIEANVTDVRKDFVRENPLNTSVGNDTCTRQP